jgi:DNA-binding response OmpR family regulator
LGQEDETIKGLEGGAVDYVTKPFSPKLLLARAHVALREAAYIAPGETASSYNDGYLSLDLAQRRVLVEEKPVKLTPIEYRLLAYLFQNAGRILTFNEILERVWGVEYRNNTNYIHSLHLPSAPQPRSRPRTPALLAFRAWHGLPF